MVLERKKAHIRKWMQAVGGESGWGYWFLRCFQASMPESTTMAAMASFRESASTATQTDSIPTLTRPMPTTPARRYGRATTNIGVLSSWLGVHGTGKERATGREPSGLGRGNGNGLIQSMMVAGFVGGWAAQGSQTATCANCIKLTDDECHGDEGLQKWISFLGWLIELGTDEVERNPRPESQDAYVDCILLIYITSKKRYSPEWGISMPLTSAENWLCYRH
jgi:hypothetical protein